MCGIVGIAGVHEHEWLTGMNTALRHRGPDDAGEYRDPEGEVGLAMHRLSILDLAGGSQPMSNEDGTLWIVHNGEIYNSPDLRTNLESRGHRFGTKNADTEVLLHLYEEKQEEMLADLNGMFAFVIYDRLRRVLFGARDRIGIKPLYYARRPPLFVFGSELKSLVSLPWISRDINLESLFHYMSLRFIPGMSSIFREVHRVPPGHWFRYSLQTHELEIHPYWRPRFHPKKGCDQGRWSILIREELRAAIRRWILSDVPVGVSLSGGLDSSTIVGLLGELGVSPIRTYSLGFSGPGEEDWNELPLARKVAERWGTEHHELVLEPDDLLRDLLRMVWYLDEPYGGGLPSWYVFEFMRRHVKVGLTGTGGDELFGDYGRFRPFEVRVANGSTGTTPWWAPAWHPVAALLNRVPDAWLDLRRKRELLHLPDVRRDPFRWHYVNRYFYLPDESKRQAVFSVEMGSIPDTARVLEEYYRASDAASTRDAVGYVGFATQLPEEFLLMTDRFSMAHGLEARVPFLDHEFVEFMHQVPAEIRTDPRNLKYLLRLAVGDLLPPEVLGGRKRGFVIPTARWLCGTLRPLAERMLSADRLAEQGIFHPDFYRRYVVPHFDGRVDYHAEIWTALMFQLWHLLFIEERLTDTPAFSWQDLC